MDRVRRSHLGQRHQCRPQLFRRGQRGLEPQPHRPVAARQIQPLRVKAREPPPRRVATGELNRWFEAALERHQPPLVDGRRLKLRYTTQAKARPPTFVVFGTRAEQTPEDYQRYLVNSLRDTFALPGTPVRLQFRGTKNPYAEE